MSTTITSSDSIQPTYPLILKEVSEDVEFAEFMDNYHKWSAADVLDWLHMIGFSEYIPTFEHNKVSGYDLVRITQVDLEDMGIEQPYARRLYREIANLTSLEFTKKPQQIPKKNSVPSDTATNQQTRPTYRSDAKSKKPRLSLFSRK
jgi:hypothetical protein